MFILFDLCLFFFFLDLFQKFLIDCLYYIWKYILMYILHNFLIYTLKTLNIPLSNHLIKSQM